MYVPHGYVDGCDTLQEIYARGLDVLPNGYGSDYVLKIHCVFRVWL